MPHAFITRAVVIKDSSNKRPHMGPDLGEFPQGSSGSSLQKLNGTSNVGRKGRNLVSIAIGKSSTFSTVLRGAKMSS